MTNPLGQMAAKLLSMLLLLFPVVTPFTSISQHRHSSSLTSFVSQEQQCFPTAFRHCLYNDGGDMLMNKIHARTMMILWSSTNEKRGSSPLQSASTQSLFPEKLNIIYDGKCSVCRMEMESLAERVQYLAAQQQTQRDKKYDDQADEHSLLLRFTDLESGYYNENDPMNGGVTYEMGMTSIHAIQQDGTIIHGVDVFREAYSIVGMGWVYALTSINPTFRNFSDGVYNFFATHRTRVTRGAELQDLINQHYNNEGKENTIDNNEEECIPCNSNQVPS